MLGRDDDVTFDNLEPFQYVLSCAIAFGLISVVVAIAINITFAIQVFLLMLMLPLLRIWTHNNKARKWIVDILLSLFFIADLVITRGWTGAVIAIPKLCGIGFVLLLIAWAVRKLGLVK